MHIFPFRLGGEVNLFLEIYSGSVAGVTNPEAFIRKMAADRTEYLDDAPSIEMAVAFQAAAGDQPAGWNVSINALEPQFEKGFYGVDFWMTVGAGKPSLERQLVQLREAAGP